MFYLHDHVAKDYVAMSISRHVFFIFVGVTLLSMNRNHYNEEIILCYHVELLIGYHVFLLCKSFIIILLY